MRRETRTCLLFVTLCTARRIRALTELLEPPFHPGVLCPHFIVFAESTDPKDCLEDDEVPPGDERLLLVTTRTRDFLPEEIGTLEMMRETEKAVSKAWRSIFPPEQPDLIPDFFVQIKCPLLTPARIAEAASRGKTCVTDDCYRSMALSRGASSLGAALSRDDLLEFLTDTNGIILSTKVTKPGDIEQEHICMDIEDAGSKFYSNFVSSSAGVELMHCEILIIGNGPDSRSRHKVSCGFMRDAIDIDGVKACVERLGGEKIVTVLAKADPAAFVRGRRTTQLSDSDIHPTRHARAAVGGVVAAATGDPRVYVSGGAEHQGPSGGGSMCAISMI